MGGVDRMINRARPVPLPAREPNGLRLLDLYCCAGGASMGYHLAGFEVTGVDIAPQPRYPFTFHQADAIDYVRAHSHEYDIIAASPPCQADCTLTAGTNQDRRHLHRSLLANTRDALMATGRPWLIEQPTGKAKMRRDLLLCGLMFDLAVFRHRQFELHGLTLPQPAHPSHQGHRVRGWRHGRYYDGDMVAVYGDGGGKGSVTDWQQAMGIGWTDARREIAEAIPPAYTLHIGHAVARSLLVQPAGRRAA